MTREDRQQVPPRAVSSDSAAAGRDELPPELEAMDAELRSYARDVSPTPPQAFLVRAHAAVEDLPTPTPARSFLEALSSRSFTSVVSAYRANLGAAFGRDVPLGVRLQSVALSAVVALFLATGATFGATGASEVLRYIAGAPPPSAPPEVTFEPSPSRTPGATATSAATPTTDARVHIVEAGQTLSAIAELYGVPLEDLIEANAISNPDLIQIGQRLVIPA